MPKTETSAVSERKFRLPVPDAEVADAHIVWSFGNNEGKAIMLLPLDQLMTPLCDPLLKGAYFL